MEVRQTANLCPWLVVSKEEQTTKSRDVQEAATEKVRDRYGHLYIFENSESIVHYMEIHPG